MNTRHTKYIALIVKSIIWLNKDMIWEIVWNNHYYYSSSSSGFYYSSKVFAAITKSFHISWSGTIFLQFRAQRSSKSFSTTSIHLFRVQRAMPWSFNIRFSAQYYFGHFVCTYTSIRNISYIGLVCSDIVCREGRRGNIYKIFELNLIILKTTRY